MNKNIIKTKQKLTIIFTIIVTLVIIFLGTSFFSFKYYHELSIEKDQLNDLGERIQSKEIGIEDFIGFSRMSGNNIERKDIGQALNKPDNGKPGKGDAPANLVPLSYIEFNQNNILSYDFKVNIEEDNIKKLLNSNIINKSFELDGFLIRKIQFGESGIILFSGLRYNFSNYLSDILIFIFGTLIFSSLLYLIGNRFVNRAFIPVEQNMKDMNDFIHNSGHELKTPIAVIDSNIQYLKDVKIYDEEMMDEIKYETQKLNSLINSLIKLSDISDLKVTKEDISINDVINDILNNFKESISDKNINVKVKISSEVYIHANRDYLYILLSNLIGNAIKYNVTGGKIKIAYDNDQLAIKDTGIGMSQEDIENIFDRFYKADKSRNTDGFGIGLSLVKKIINMYEWDILVESKVSKGSIFTIVF